MLVDRAVAGTLRKHLPKEHLIPVIWPLEAGVAPLLNKLKRIGLDENVSSARLAGKAALQSNS